MVSKKNLLAATILSLILLSTIAYAGQDDLSSLPLKGRVFSSFLALPVEGDPYRVWFDKGKILYSQMAYREAFDAFTKIDKNAPPDLLDESLYLSANSLMETGSYDEAASFANAVSNKSPVYPFALYTMAMINLKTGNEKKAAEYLEDITKYVRTAQPSTGKKTGETPGALSGNEELAHRANLTLGFMHLEKGNHDDALKYFSAIPKGSQFHATAMRYYKDTSAKITGLKNGIQRGDFDKIAHTVGIYGDDEMSDRLKLYNGLLEMEEYLGQLSPGASPEAESLISGSKKMREDILDDVYAN